MNKESKKLAEVIQNLDPDIIIISGSTNPTYFDDSFYEVLFPKNKVQLGIVTESSIWDGNIKDWIIKIIEKISEDYEVVKYKDVYVVGEYEVDEYVDDRNGNVIIDYGGNIELIFLDKLKKEK
jgi:hypothetical protein